VIYSRPYQPQTLGKDERFHRTLKNDVIKRQAFCSFPACQAGFDTWRKAYNYERPHESLSMNKPSSRYHSSQWEFPEVLPPIEFPPVVHVRKANYEGRIRFLNRNFRAGRAFDDYYVAVRPTHFDGDFDVYFCKQKIKTISFREKNDYVFQCYPCPQTSVTFVLGPYTGGKETKQNASHHWKAFSIQFSAPRGTRKPNQQLRSPLIFHLHRICGGDFIYGHHLRGSKRLFCPLFLSFLHRLRQK
jgi:Integrase core domain